MERTRKKMSSKNQPCSVLQADQLFVKKILSRNSSVGDHSSHLESFRAPAEVPFKWESRPGEPKDGPKKTLPQPTTGDSPPPSTAMSEARTLRSAPPAGVGLGLSRTKVRLFWRKLIQKGQRRLNIRNNVDRPSARFTPSVASAPGFYSSEIGGLDRRLSRSDHHPHSASHVVPTSSCSSPNNLGFSKTPDSSPPTSPTNGHNLRLDRSKLQGFTRGCIKWMF